jgi:hypothetical protein
MYVFRLLGKIVDDARHGMSHFESWQMDGAVVYDCYGDFINEEIANFVDVAEGVDYSVTFRANADCRFEIAQVSFVDENGEERFFDVREQVEKDVEADGLLTEYYDLCEKAVALA